MSPLGALLAALFVAAAFLVLAVVVLVIRDRIRGETRFRLERRPPSGRADRVAAKLFGPPPAAGASAAERWRYVRRVSSLPMLICVPATIAFGLTYGPSKWEIITFSAILLFGLWNVVGLTLKIRQLERREREGP